MADTISTLKLYRGQKRTLSMIMYNPGKTTRLDLTGLDVDVVDNYLPIEPIPTVTDATEGECSLVLEAASDSELGVFTFRIRVGEGSVNELDWPPIEVQIK